MEEVVRCERCSLEFSSKYYEGGSIQHENFTNKEHLEILYNRGSFLSSLNLMDDNYCNVKNISSFTMGCVQKCMLMWLMEKDIKLYDICVTYLAERKRKLNYILKDCDRETKIDLTYYYARVNKLIESLYGLEEINIMKIRTISGKRQYVAYSNIEPILLDTD